MAGLTNHLQSVDRQQNFAAAAAATQNGQTLEISIIILNVILDISGHPSGDSGKDGLGVSVSPPSSPTHGGSVFTNKLTGASSPVAGLPQPGSYPHPTGQPGPAGGQLGQVNGGPLPAPGLSQQPNNLQDQLQQQQKVSRFTLRNFKNITLLLNSSQGPLL